MLSTDVHWVQEPYLRLLWLQVPETHRDGLFKAGVILANQGCFVAPEGRLCNAAGLRESNTSLSGP